LANRGRWRKVMPGWKLKYWRTRPGCVTRNIVVLNDGNSANFHPVIRVPELITSKPDAQACNDRYGGNQPLDRPTIKRTRPEHHTVNRFVSSRGRGFNAGLLTLLVGGLVSGSAFAQDNYEIQVYGAETVPEGEYMVELHSNYTIEGSPETINGVLPSRHAVHETLEITHGFTPWFETGFYVFSSIQPGRGWEWVGDHVRPRVRVPESWHWPLGLSLSSEIGYQRRIFSNDTWSWELRPIIDKQWGRWYAAVNPAFELGLSGPASRDGFTFAPSAKIGYDLTKQISPGVEYYSGLGRVTHFDPFGEQQHQIMPVVDLNVSPKWEINFGVGIGLNHSTDHLLVKLILGRRF